jgi:hypothetical protein
MVCSLGNMSAITLHQEYDQLVASRGCPAHVASNLEADVLFVALDCTGGRCRLIGSCALAANTEPRFRKDLSDRTGLSPVQAATVAAVEREAELRAARMAAQRSEIGMECAACHL